MAAPDLPIFANPQAAAALQAGLAQVEDTRRDIERLLEAHDWELPVKLTAYHASGGCCSWSLQTYDRDGRRRDAYVSVTGSNTYMPAYPVGNGVMPPPAFPVEVTLRPRILHDTLGWIWEFEWSCACDAGYSGSGAV